MTVTYFLREQNSWGLTGNSQILRIVDRNTILTGTLFGCIYIDRTEATRILRNFLVKHRSPDHKWTYGTGAFTTFEYEKEISA